MEGFEKGPGFQVERTRSHFRDFDEFDDKT